MTSTPNQYSVQALKEWESVVAALGRGEQIAILRKGGLRDGRSGFTLRAREFLLFPTQYHLPDTSEPSQSRSETVSLTHFARIVAEHWDLAQEEIASAMGRDFIAADYLDSRLGHQPEKPCVMLLVRVYRLPAPLVIPRRPEYDGCASWISLDLPFSPKDCIPVLDDVAFMQRIHIIEQTLNLKGEHESQQQQQ